MPSDNEFRTLEEAVSAEGVEPELIGRKAEEEGEAE